MERLKRAMTITASRVIKQQQPRAAAVELEKTQRAADIARRDGSFTVPRVVSADPLLGTIEFERLHNLVPLWYVMRQDRSGRNFVELAARALAAVHGQLTLATTMQVPLPDVWLQPQPAPLVCLHGDFNAWNVSVHRPTARLVVTDWSASDLCGGTATVGPYMFDVAWFIASLFTYRYAGWDRLAAAQEFAATFLETYGSAGQTPNAAAECGQYLKDILNELDRWNDVSGPRWTAAVRRVRKRYLSTTKLRTFAALAASET